MARRILFAMLLLCAAATAQIQPYIQSYANSGTQVCPYPQNVVSGNILVVGASTEGTLTGISDTLTSTWVLIDSSTANAITTRVWVAPAASSGADTVTVTGTSTFNNISCVEFDQALYTATVDVHTNGGYTGSPATVTATLTTTLNGDLFYAYVSGFQSSGEFQPVPPLQLSGVSASSDAACSGYLITGTNGVYNAVFNAINDSKGNFVAIALEPVAIKITTSALPTAAQGQSYSYQLNAVNGAGAYTWSLSSGALPSGLSLNASTGVISGMATTTTTTPTFQVTDGTHTATRALTLTVNGTASTPSLVNSGAATAQVLVMAGVSSGDVLVAARYMSINPAGSGNSWNSSPPTDSLSTPYKYVGSAVGALWPQWIAIWIGKASAGGTDTITFPNISTDVSDIVVDFAGAQSFFDTEVNTNGHSASSATITSNAITTVSPNSAIYFAGLACATATTFTPNAPFVTATTSNGLATSYNVASATGSYTPNYAITGNTGQCAGYWNLAALALRPSTSGPVVTSAIRRKGWVF